MRELKAIHEDIQSTQAALDERNADEGQNKIWRDQLEGFNKEKEAAEAQLQNINDRVEQAKETGYILDTIEIDGLPSIAFSHTPENHELLAIAVQKWALEQQDAFNKTISDMEYELTQERILNNDLTGDVEKLERENSQLTLELKHAELSKDNAAKIIGEKDDEIKRLKEIQTNKEAVSIAPLTKEEKEKNLMVEVMGKQIKVVDVVAINPDSFTNKMFKATNAVTGAYVEDYYIYLSLIGENKPKRYEEVSDEAAEQLRTEYAAKKAELENIIPVQPPEIAPVNNVTETVEAATDVPFQEEVQAADSGTDQTADRDTTQATLVGWNYQESEVITLESLHERVKALELKVAA